MGNTYGNALALRVGKEKCIAATKSMITTMMGMHLLGLHLGRTMDRFAMNGFERELAPLKALPGKLNHFVNEVPAVHDKLQAFVKGLTETSQFILLSHGTLVSALPEAALKLRETSRNTVDYDNSASYEHGFKTSMQGVNKIAHNVLYVVPKDPADAQALYRDVRKHFEVPPQQGGLPRDRVFFIRYEDSPKVPQDIQKMVGANKAGHILTLPGTKQFDNRGLDTQVLGITTFQLLGYYLALAKGVDPNGDPILSKAVVEKPTA